MTSLKRLNLSGQGITNAGLVHLGAMVAMEELSLRDTGITSLEPLRGSTNLKHLDLVGSPIDDRGLRTVAEFQKLELLWLGGSQVSDAGLAHLKALPNLRILDLDRTKVGDAGLAFVCSLPRISTLNLFSTQVTDAGLAGVCERLGQTPCSDLVVSGPNVTASGIEFLRSKLPGIRVTGPDLEVTKRASSAGK